jgi:hypothetical protein
MISEQKLELLKFNLFQDELEKGIDVSPITIAKIKSLVPMILHLQKDIGIKYVQNHKVFQLQENPHLVFKMGVSSQLDDQNKHEVDGKSFDDAELIEYRFDNMITAKQVCLAHNLNLLVIPHAKKFTLTLEDRRKCVIIAEEYMNISAKESDQEEYYHTYSKDLNETARQLAVFVAKTGFHDVTPRNIPIINEAKDFVGSRRVALIDLEHLKDPIKGFAGDNFVRSRGLIRCVSEDQIDIVIEEAHKNGFNSEDLDDAKEMRLKEIAEERRKICSTVLIT